MPDAYLVLSYIIATVIEGLWMKVLKNREMILTLESRWNDSISFQGGNEDIETPEKDKNTGGQSLYWLGSSQFSANGRVTTDHQNEDGKEGLKK